ncbi:MAG: hypothetical protein E7594_01415 [Ruminococcaceae bacterium]|nr:hypothetical protein [Oscillospiraceae bacterium]
MKYIKIAAALLALLLLLCSCTSVDEMLEAETADLTPPAKDSADLLDIPDYLSMPLEEYVTLGAYTGQEIRIEGVELSDETVQRAIEDIKTANGLYEKITDGTAKWGDTLVISYYDAMKDSVAGENDVEITLAEGSGYPDDFVKGLIGAPCGIPVLVNVENDAKTTSYTVTVSYIKGEYLDFSDEFITAYTSGACTKANEFFAYYKEQLWNEMYYDTVYDALWDACEANCKAEIVPDEAVSYYMKSMEDYYRRMANSNGVSYEEVLAAFELDEIKIMTLSYSYAEKDMIFYAVVKDAGLQISDEAYDKALHDYAEKYYSTFAPGVGKGSGQGGKVTVEDVAAYLDAEQGNIIRELCYDQMLYDYLYENNQVFMGEVPMN